MTPEIIAVDPSWPYTKAKTAVLAAAAAVIREDGPRAATLKNIAGRAGITEPAIFRHFNGVDGLFGGLFHAFERVYQRFDEVYHTKESGMARLRTAILSIVDYLAASRDFAYILIHAQQVFRGYPDLRRKIGEYARKDEENALSCITEGVSRGEIRGDVDPLTLASTIIGTVYITAIMWLDSGFAFDLREVCDARWEDLERLISVEQGGKRASPRRHAASHFTSAARPRTSPEAAEEALRVHSAPSPRGARAGGQSLSSSVAVPRSGRGAASKASAAKAPVPAKAPAARAAASPRRATEKAPKAKPRVTAKVPAARSAAKAAPKRKK